MADDFGGDNGGSSDQTSSSDGATKPTSPPKIVPLPQKREVAPNHLEQLRESCLNDETIQLADLYTERHHKRLAELVGRARWNPACGNALVFPFYYPGAPEPYAQRVKPTYARKDKKGKAVKYDQAAHHKTLIYFPPRTRTSGALTDATKPLVWTEGEKKSLLLDQLGYAAIGLTGVWMWGDKEHRDLTGEQRLHPTLANYVTVAGREHVIVFDADSRVKDDVMHAAGKLCGVLLAAGAVSVKFVCPPDIKTKGVDDYCHVHGVDATLALIASAEALTPLEPNQALPAVRSYKALRDAPLPEALRMPPGYELERDGSLWRAESEGDARAVCDSPMFITRLLVDSQTEELRAEVTYLRGERWVTRCVSRRAICDARVLVLETADFGAPVSTQNAGRLVEWFTAFEHTNLRALESVTSVDSTGWHDVGEQRVFVTHEVIGSDELVVDTRGDRSKLFAALKPRGTLEAHVEALRAAWQADPVCAVMISASLAAPLLYIVGASNFAVHLPGESSRGKTSMLKIAASIWGNPESGQWLATWNMTRSAAEVRAQLLCDLPQCYDEIGGGDAEAAEALVFSLCGGTGRHRTTRDLKARAAAAWRTILLSTGERELASEETATGAQVRVVQLPVRGFGKLTADEIDAVRAACAANAGSVGAAWARFLVEHMNEWPEWCAQYAEMTRALRAEAKGDPLRGRVAANFALLALAERLAAAAFGLGTRDGDTVCNLFEDDNSREAVRGVAERAYDLVSDWVLSEPDSFPQLDLTPSGDEDAPPTRGSTRTRHGFRRSDGALLVIPAEFRAFCQRHRLAHREVLREWARRGWSVTDPSRIDKNVRLGPGTHARFIVLPQRSQE